MLAMSAVGKLIQHPRRVIEDGHPFHPLAADMLSGGVNGGNVPNNGTDTW